jgi:hypothetical protein
MVIIVGPPEAERLPLSVPLMTWSRTGLPRRYGPGPSHENRYHLRALSRALKGLRGPSPYTAWVMLRWEIAYRGDLRVPCLMFCVGRSTGQT